MNFKRDAVLCWLRELCVEWGHEYTIHPTLLANYASRDTLQAFVETYVSRGWKYGSVSWDAILDYASLDQPSLAIYLLWKFGPADDPYKRSILIKAQEESRWCTGRDGARLRKKIKEVLSASDSDASA